MNLASAIVSGLGIPSAGERRRLQNRAIIIYSRRVLASYCDGVDNSTLTGYLLAQFCGHPKECMCLVSSYTGSN